MRGGAGHETNLGSERDMLLSRGRGCALVRLYAYVACRSKVDRDWGKPLIVLNISCRERVPFSQLRAVGC